MKILDKINIIHTAFYKSYDINDYPTPFPNNVSERYTLPNYNVLTFTSLYPKIITFKFEHLFGIFDLYRCHKIENIKSLYHDVRIVQIDTIAYIYDDILQFISKKKKKDLV